MSECAPWYKVKRFSTTTFSVCCHACMFVWCVCVCAVVSLGHNGVSELGHKHHTSQSQIQVGHAHTHTSPPAADSFFSSPQPFFFCCGKSRVVVELLRTNARTDLHVRLAAHLHFRVVPENVGNVALGAPDAVLHAARSFHR